MKTFNRKNIQKEMEKDRIQKEKGYSMTELVLAFLASAFLAVIISGCVKHSNDVNNIHSAEALGGYNQQVTKLPKPINTNNIKVEDFDKLKKGFVKDNSKTDSITKDNQNNGGTVCGLNNNSCKDKTTNTNSTNNINKQEMDEEVKETIDDLLKDILDNN